MSLPIIQNEDIPNFKYIEQIRSTLHNQGCRRCDLGFQANINGCCVSRGSTTSRVMVVGEAPGKDEDSKRLPFTGPAGRLMDKIFGSVGINTKDIYITNVVKCRPVAQKGSGKENFTPKVEQQKRCKTYLDSEIELLNPSLIVTLGRIATAAVTEVPSVKMKDVRGTLVKREDGIKVFPMLHPAAILHAQRDPELQKLYKIQTWEDIQKLKNILDEDNLI